MSEEVQTEEVVETTETTTDEKVQTTEDSKAFVDSMLEQIDNEDVKSAGFWKNLEGKSANEVGQYIKELQSFAGKKGDIPKKDASEEEWNAFYQKLGRPDSSDGYDFTLSDDFKSTVGEESVPFYEEAIKGFKEKAFELGTSNDQAEGLINWYLEMVANDVNEANKFSEESKQSMDAELKKSWGDEYKGMMNGIEVMLKANGMPEENLKLAKEAGLLQDPSFAVALGKIASKFADDPEIGHHQTKTQAGIRDQLAEIEMEVASYIKSGESIPNHIKQKRMDLMNKLGEDL